MEQIAQMGVSGDTLRMRAKQMRGGRIDPQDVAIRMAALRRYTGLTQEEMASVANGPKFRVTKGGRRVPSGSPSWAAYEAGTYLITVYGADRLCDRFGITLDWIYRGAHVGMTFDISSALLKAELEVEKARKTSQ